MKEIKPFYLDLTQEEIRALQDEFGNILNSGQLILGKHTEDFESSFAKYVGCNHAVALNSATSALEVLCMLKDVCGKKVAVPSNTNFASVMAILKAGGQPIFMEMTKEYFAPSVDILKETIKEHKVEGVMWVHIGGIITPDFIEVSEFCNSHDLFLIEDAAHAHGSWIDGMSAGNIGDGGAFSFFPTKVMTTMEGGMITTNSKEEADLVKSYRNQGKRHAAFGGLHYDQGNSWRLSEIAAYMGIIQLAKLDDMVGRRQSAVTIISKALNQYGINFCDTSHMDKCSQYKFIILVPSGKNVNTIKENLSAKGIFCGGGVYEVPCHLQPVFEDISYNPASLTTTEEFCPRHICPPITSGTTPEDAERMAKELVDQLK